MQPPGLRVLIFQELPGLWVARGLEHDLAVEGRTPASVIARFHRLVSAQAAFDRRHGRAPLSPFPAAPQRYWRAFDRATRLPARTGEAQDGESDFGPITVALTSEFPAPSIPASPVNPSLRRGRPLGPTSRPRRPAD